MYIYMYINNLNTSSLSIIKIVRGFVRYFFTRMFLTDNGYHYM